MKKIIAVSLILGVMLATVGLVIAGQDSFSTSKRVIVPTTSFVDKVVFKMKGCDIIHNLDDSTALKCPPSVAIGLKNVREDRIFKIIDLEADEQIGADLVWAQGIDGTGVNVAVLDTGIDTDHPDLSDNIIGCETFVIGTTTCEDDHGHGTHVSGIITAKGVDSMAKGVAPGAGIYMYKVCDANGACYESDMMAAMEAAVLTDAKVMSISIGGGNFAGENCDTDPLADKVNGVAGYGITVAVASGNDQYYVSSPACASGAIAVGAVDKSGLMASFSNFGPALDIVAPGVNIYSPIINGYASWDGTSMSTPHVSGVVALMLENNLGLTTSEIKTALYETATDINPDSICYGVVRTTGARVWIGEVECTSDNYGAGIVDAYGAVNYFTQAEPECVSDTECDDSVSCTIDICNEENLCENNPNDILCDDGLYCNGFETCDVISDCQVGVLVDCSDLGNQCNDGVCDEDTDSCIAQPKIEGTLCDDELFCTENDYCSAGICLSGTSKTCDDSESCTTDSCNEDLDACENTWPSCSLTIDGCCGPECDSTTDIDCPVASCLNCFKEICDGRCHPTKEDSTCPDCVI